MGRLEETDETLMTAYARGDKRAFQTLFSRFAPRIHGFFRRSFHHESLADDLLQATFLKIHQGRRQYSAEFPVRVWFFTIAARVRLDELRRHYRLPEDAGDEELDKADEARSLEAAREANEGEMRELAERVRNAINQLPDTQRVVVHLNRFEGMTFGEIAQVLGTTEGAVKLRAFRAYETLRNLLREALRPEARSA